MRVDLYALTAASLEALSNRGLVNRAQKEITDGKGPQLSEEDDGTVVGKLNELGKDITTRLIPKKGLRECPCSCGATVICRHRVAVALAYKPWIDNQASGVSAPEVVAAPAPAPEPTPAPVHDSPVLDVVASPRGSRADLLALTPAAMEALTNRGLVNRAQKEISEGKGPQLSEEADGTVVGKLTELGKEITTRLIPGKQLRECLCSCGATVVCRHRVAVVLAYKPWVDGVLGAAPEVSKAEVIKAEVGAPKSAVVVKPPGFTPWSPTNFSDELLLSTLGKKNFTAAKTQRKKGVVVDIRLPSAEHPDAIARLPTSTVRFLVPNDISYVQCDCYLRVNCVHVAIAVWAYRAVPADVHERLEWRVEVVDGERNMAERPEITDALALSRDVLMEGVVNTRPSLDQRFAQVIQGIEAAGHVWPAVIIEELQEALSAYRSRSARYNSAWPLELMASIAARRRALAQGGEEPATSILGVRAGAKEKTSGTYQLLPLGARVEADGDSRILSIVYVDEDDGDMLWLEKTFDKDASTPDPLTGPQIAGRNVSNIGRAERVARNRLKTARLSRRADGSISIGARSFGAGTEVDAVSPDWSHFPDTCRVRSLREKALAWEQRVPRPLRPRRRAENMAVFPVASIVQIAYDSGEQRLIATATDPEETPFYITRSYRAVAPLALEHIHDALSGKYGAVKYVSGEISRRLGFFELEVMAICADKVIVPDLETSTPGSLPETQVRSSPMPVETAIREALLMLEEGVHQGLKSLPNRFPERIDDVADDLDATGLSGCGRRVRRFGSALKAAWAGEENAWEFCCERWEDAALRLLLAQEATG